MKFYLSWDLNSNVGYQKTECNSKRNIQNEEQNTSFVKSVIRIAARLALFLRMDVFLLEAHFYTYIRHDESSSASRDSGRVTHRHCPQSRKPFPRNEKERSLRAPSILSHSDVAHFREKILIGQPEIVGKRESTLSIPLYIHKSEATLYKSFLNFD